MSRKLDVVTLDGEEFDALQDEITRLRSLLERARDELALQGDDYEPADDPLLADIEEALHG